MLCNIGPDLFLSQCASISETEGGQRDQGRAGPKTQREERKFPCTEVKPSSKGGNHGHTHTGTEVSPTSPRHCGKVQDSLLLSTCGITVSFYSLCFQVHPTVSHVNEREAERKKELLHACRQPSSPQSVLMWSSSSLCMSKNKQNRRDIKSKAKAGGPFQSFWLFTLSRLFQTNRPLEVLAVVSL